MCPHLGSHFAERVVEAREDRTRGATGAAGLNIESWKNHLRCIKQLAQDLTFAKDVQD